MVERLVQNINGVLDLVINPPKIPPFLRDRGGPLESSYPAKYPAILAGYRMLRGVYAMTVTILATNCREMEAFPEDKLSHKHIGLRD